MLADGIEQLDVVARHFVEHIGDRRVFAFRGTMGAGKTTFIKAICRELGVGDDVNSPTFAIVNEYRSDTLDSPVYHFDFYRIDTADDALRIGVQDYFDSGCLCFIEWPEKISTLLPDDVAWVSIEETADGKREILF
jgi:tRNA threonylcarbamoyladenosine biosynthesis protein TsaE